MINLTEEQAQQIEEALVNLCNSIQLPTSDVKALATIRAAREQAAKPQKQEERRGGIVGVIGWAANLPNTMMEVHWEDGCPPIGTKLYAAPVEPVTQEPVDTLRGFSLWLDREAWGHVIDGLMLERERSEQRKAANPESNSNHIANRCAELIAQIGQVAATLVEPVTQEPCKPQGHFEQPNWAHVGQAFIDGAREAKANPDADEDDFIRAADGYTKRLFEQLDPESERLLRENAYSAPIEHRGAHVTDEQIIDAYCATPQMMSARYTELSMGDKFAPITPQELAAVLTRLNDGTINKAGALKVIDELERRNKVFIKFVGEITKEGA